MKSIQSSKDLQKIISSLESQRIQQEILIKERWEEVKESLRPVNIVKRSFKEMVSGTTPKSALFGSIAAIGVSMLATKFVRANASNGLRKWMGSLLQVGIRSLLAKKDSEEKDKPSLFKKLFSRKKKPELLPG